MYLKSTSETLEIDLEGAADPEVLTLVSYVDHHYGNDTKHCGCQEGSSADTTDTTILAAPAEGTWREIKEILVFNSDNAAATVTIQLNNGTIARPVFKAALPAGGEHIQWNPSGGWTTILGTGALYTTAHA